MGKQGPLSQSRHRVRRAVQSVVHWVLFRGNRLALIAIVLVAVFGSLLALTGSGYFATGPNSNAATLFASGLTAGVLTVVTLVLSINQLILSRVFGSPKELSDQLEGTKQFRAEVERIADVPSTPNDPAAFLALIGATIARTARELSNSLEADGDAIDEDVLDTLDDAADYGDRISESLEPEMSIAEVLYVLLETEYARKMTDVHEMRNLYADRLSVEHRDELEDIESLFGLVAITRQFFKTLALQENFARLSRMIAVTGLGAFFSSVSLAFLYRSNSVTLAPDVMPLVVSIGLTIVVAPVVAVIVYVLRAATVALHTLSVGPFVQPSQ